MAAEPWFLMDILLHQHDTGRAALDSKKHLRNSQLPWLLGIDSFVIPYEEI